VHIRQALEHSASTPSLLGQKLLKQGYLLKLHKGRMQRCYFVLDTKGALAYHTGPGDATRLLLPAVRSLLTPIASLWDAKPIPFDANSFSTGAVKQATPMQLEGVLYACRGQHNNNAVSPVSPSPPQCLSHAPLSLYHAGGGGGSRRGGGGAVAGDGCRWRHPAAHRTGRHEPRVGVPHGPRGSAGGASPSPRTVA
jgi:hypothetical protein